MPETIKISCSGYDVVADWYEGESDKEILLVLIGYTSNRNKQYDLVSSIVKDTDMSALVFDYSGHGDSPFELNDTRPAQHFLEVIYVFDWLRSTYPGRAISVMGSSYGGYLATLLTMYRDFSKLVLRVPAIYTPESFYDLQEKIHNSNEKNILRRNKELLSKHPLLLKASRYKGRVLVVIHGRDEDIPRETTDAYISAFNADSYIVEEFTHSIGNPENPREKFAEYQNYIAQWLKNN